MLQLLTGIMILTALSASVVMYSSSLIQKGKKSVLAENLSVIRNALEDFCQTNGRYPQSLSELTLPSPSGLSLLKEIPADPFTQVADWEVKKGQSGFTPEVKTGIAIYYPFDENSGISAVDHSGNGRDAYISGAAAWRTGKKDFSLRLSGNPNFIDLAAVGNFFDIAFNTRSAVFWFNADIVAGGFQYLFEEGTQNIGTGIYLNGGNIYVGAWRNSAPAFTAFLSTPTSAQTWHQVGYVFDWSGERLFKLFYDGVFISSFALPGNLPAHSSAEAIGRNNGNTRSHTGVTATGQYYTGLLDEVRFFQRALTTDEISTLYYLDPYQRWIDHTQEILVTGEILDIRSNDPAYQNW